MDGTFGFNTAFSYLMEGKKIRQKSWSDDGYIHIVDGDIIDENGYDFFGISDSDSLLADDWELFK